MLSKDELYKLFGIAPPFDRTGWLRARKGMLHSKEARHEVLRLLRRRLRAREVARSRQGAAIVLERLEPGRYACIAVAGGLEVGWCIKRDRGWYIEDARGKCVGGPYPSRASAKVAAQQLL